MNYKPYSYWESRLTEHYNELGVGDISLGISYNQYFYRIRKIVFARLLKRYVSVVANRSILDIGSGTGFYIEQFHRNGAQKVIGMDLTNKAVNELANKYPKYKFVRSNIGTDTHNELYDKFDIISVFDVLYHITDDKDYERALENIANYLKKGGLLFYSDNFLPGDDRFEIEHQVCRSLKRVKEVLEKHGLVIVDKIPMFVLMNTSFSRNKLVRNFFPLISKWIRKSNALGGLIGLILFPIEVILIHVLKSSSSTEVMVCQKA